MRFGCLLLMLVAWPLRSEVCYTRATQQLGYLPLASSSSVFHCPEAGQGTLNQLAQSGYEIVSLKRVYTSVGPATEEYRLIIQRAEAVFEDEFE